MNDKWLILIMFNMLRTKFQTKMNNMKSQDQISLSSLSDQMLQTSENSFVSEKQLIFPKLITLFKGPKWTTKIAQSSLKTYMSIFGKILTAL